MAKDNIVSLNAVREVKQMEQDDQAYHAMILTMEKLELLDEMVRFQQERSEKGYLTPKMMIRGKLLFKALEATAETQELQLLTRSYRRHLEHELADYIRKGMQAASETETESEADSDTDSDAR
jgi:hypothetical protein